MTVLNTLKPGLDEKLYERASAIELEKRGRHVSPKREYPVYYDRQKVGSLIPDLVIDDLVIVDTKVVNASHEAHTAQMIGYLAITGLKLAILVNFKCRRLEWKRVVR